MANGSTILNTTLPTVVGMGVTSRAIDTTLGRQSRHSKSSRGRRRKSVGPKREGYMTVRVHVGKNGGKYIIRNGKRIYI